MLWDDLRYQLLSKEESAYANQRKKFPQKGSSIK
jgi:hypothetical protein